ncbi:uncharacterized protein LOC115213326 [Octopus sinensis]|uniref:Uncharacterized protein LOC115213326 n=1 Tax=Octopus sinensis TaxID=2607531 RepID=A0A6P7SI73_9MOLL|nr:uncharacterized protein LOC115213326 [Octopus sinensis]
MECRTIWCDDSSIAIGVVLEIEGTEVEDAAWLRKADDFNHINVTELDAVLKGVNLALKWGLCSIEIKTDSVTVLGRVGSVINSERRVRTKGTMEILMKHCLGVLGELIAKFRLKLNVVFVPSERNRADAQTREKRAWLGEPEEAKKGIALACWLDDFELKRLHAMHHLGVDRTLYLMKMIDADVTRRSIRKVVGSCDRCQSIDPAPCGHEQGNLLVEHNWKRVAVDVRHYRQGVYLSMVDCRPGLLAIWRELRMGIANEIAQILNGIFLEKGLMEELLMDNEAAFHSEVLRDMHDWWKVCRLFRAVYRPSGNGIVERHHQTVKAIAERGHILLLEAVFWYNVSPRSEQAEESVPHRALFKYEWRHQSKASECHKEEKGPAC